MISTLIYIWRHPLNRNRKLKSVLLFFKWQIATRLLPYPIIYPLTSKAKILLKRGMTGATGNLYCGLMEYDDMGFLLHFLKSTDLLIDIGANVGVFTMLASAETEADSIAIEPVPSTFQTLIDNINVNKIEKKVLALNVGLGKEEGELSFTALLDTLNHVSIGNESDTVKVSIKTLDKILIGKYPILLKIDVEGYETEVLNGANRVLKDSNLKAIIIELNGSGKIYGFNEIDIHNKLLNLGFKPYSYNPLNRNLKELDSHGNSNTIYIRDINFVKERIESAKKVVVSNNRNVI